MKTALITGAGGFVGRHMAVHLRSQGYDVLGIDVYASVRRGEPWVEQVDAMRAFHDMHFAERRFDLVVHAAAAGPNRAAIDSEKGNFPHNVMLDAAMFEWAIRTQQHHVVYLSSSAVYSNDLHHPTLGGSVADGTQFTFTENMGFLHDAFDVYGETKRMGERMAAQVRDAGVNVTVVRPFSGYGEDQSEDFPFRAFIERARRRENPFTIWGDSGQVRDWIHIDDIVRAVTTLVDYGVITDPINLCTGVGTTMLELATIVTGSAGYYPTFNVDVKAPMGVRYRVGDPTELNRFYYPSVDITDVIKRALGRN